MFKNKLTAFGKACVILLLVCSLGMVVYYYKQYEDTAKSYSDFHGSVAVTGLGPVNNF